VLEIRSERPLYWRTAVLDTYDGYRWIRSSSQPSGPVEEALAGADPDDVQRHRRWVEFPGVEVRALNSELLVSAGTTLQVDGVAVESASGQGTLQIDGDPIQRGDSYSVTVYSPDPSPKQMRQAPQEYPLGLARYTQLQLPGVQDPLFDIPAAPAAPLTNVYQRPGEPMEIEFTRDDTGRYYRRVDQLSRRLTADAPTRYDAVRSVEGYLRENFDYSQNVPRHLHPLPSFLFDDGAGYCQQFSGAMALMLRMAGIPSRIATGFAPGSRLENENKFEVSDFDAHSWVEVYFPGIGWVIFDPTPAAAPAQSLGSLAVRPRGEAATERFQRVVGIESDAEGEPASAFGSSSGDDGSGSPWVSTTILVLVAGLCGLFWFRRRRLLRPEGAAPQLQELRRALPRLGWELPEGSTLMRIEATLRADAGPDASRYVGGLRANRYGPRRIKRPGPAERRSLRAALSRGRGLRHRLKGLLAIPPGGPSQPARRSSRARPGPGS
jgi:MYXO-CTERM domain-containing protein